MSEEQPTSQPQTPSVNMNPFNEIFNIWFEIFYMRILLNKTIALSQGNDGTPLILKFNTEIVDEARKVALSLLQTKFPGVPLSFTPPELESTQNKQELNGNEHA